MTGRRILVRPAQPEDLLVVAGIFSRSIRTLDFLPELHTIAEDFAFWRDVVMVEQRVWVAEASGIVAGVMADHDCWITMLYVHPNQVGTGIGSALINTAKSNMEFIRLWCFQKNTRARAFYERHGFVAAAFTNGAGNAEKEPDVRYEWRRTTAQ